MMKKNTKFIITFLSLAFFLILIFVKARHGMIFFGDENFSFWRQSKYLANPNIWLDNDYGYFLPLVLINFPTQLLFKLLAGFFSLNFMSIFYFFAPIAGVFVCSIILLRQIFPKAKTLDCLIVGVFSISAPVFASQIFGEQDIIISFVFVLLLLSYLFKIGQRKTFTFKEALVLNLIIVGINAYFQNTILLVISVGLFLLIYDYRFFWQQRKFLFQSTILFFLINCYWVLLPIYYSFFAKISFSSAINFSVEKANDVLIITSNLVKPFSIFMFTPQYTDNPTYSTFYHFYAVLPVTAIFLFFFLAIFLYKNGTFVSKQKVALAIFAVFLIFFVFALGATGPTKSIFMFFWNYIPGFQSYRSIVKFQFITYFIGIILLSIALKIYQEGRIVKYFLLICTLFLSSFYFINSSYKIFTRQYQIPDDYYRLEDYLNSRKIVSVYKAFPDHYFDSAWSYTSFNWNATKTDSSNIIQYFSKQKIAFKPSSENPLDKQIQRIFCHTSDDKSQDQKLIVKVFQTLNIGGMIFQNDVADSEICDRNINGLVQKDIGKIGISLIKDIDFLPVLYSGTPSFSENPIQMITSASFNQTRPVVFRQKDGDNFSFANQEQPAPIIEFKKINAGKYRAIIHGAKGTFPLIFSESFNSGWKLYPISQNNLPDMAKNNMISNLSANYKIIDNNQNEQASTEQVKSFINSRIVSQVPDAGNINFVSKNFQGTIQNDNMDNGSTFETWFKTPIDEKNHLEANGYANSWIINTSSICNDSKKCIKNFDGSYDLEVVLDFWPQRIFYLGAFISILSLLFGSGYILLKLKKHEKR